MEGQMLPGRCARACGAVFVLAGLVLLCSSPLRAAHAQTLVELLQAIHKTDPTLLSHRFEIRAAVEGENAARAGRAPTLSARLTQGVNSFRLPSGGETWQLPPEGESSRLDPLVASLRLTQPLFDGAVGHRVTRSLAQTRIARLELEQEWQSIILETATVYLDVLRDREALDVARHNVRQLEIQMRATEARIEAGVETKTALARTRARLAAAQASLTSARSILVRSEASFLQVTGRAPGRLLRPPEPANLPGNLNEVLHAALREHPALLIARERQHVQRLALKEAAAALAPSVRLQGELLYNREQDRENTEFTSVIGQVTFSVPLYDGGLTSARIRYERARLGSQTNSIEATLRAVRAQATGAFAEYHASVSAQRAGRQQVDAAELALEGEKVALESGEGNQLRVLDAEQDLFEARIALTRARRDRQVAAYRILGSMGRLDEKRLGIILDAPPEVAIRESTGLLIDLFLGSDNWEGKPEGPRNSAE